MQYTGVEFFASSAVRFCWYLAAYFPVGLPVLREAWNGMRQRDFFTEYTLMSLAAIGAFYIGEYPEGVAVMLFYSIGEALQERAVERARRNIRALVDIRPEQANVLEDGKPVAMPAAQVVPGRTIEVLPGGRVPLDGVLLSEAAPFNTAALTGESTPRTICKGDEVLAGMISSQHPVRIEVTRPYGESALSRILSMVEEAAARKAPAELFIRRFARIYTPVVTGLAVLIVALPGLWSLLHGGFAYSFDEWLSRALVFLVASCPCALVISIPLGYFSGIGVASKAGVLFKGGSYLDAIARVNTVVFDKTGTLTEGLFEVREVHVALSMVEEAAARKAPAELFIRRFARIYTPVVTGLAVLIVALPGLWSLLHGGFAYSFDEWLSRALVFLVASCPCALVISIPLGYFSGIGVASKAGVLFKGGSYLDAIARVNTVVFDKTGTLTEGLFEVREVHVAPGVNSGELLGWVASAERTSIHPVARAVVQYAEREGVALLASEGAVEIAGHGIRAEFDGKQLLVGNTRLMARFGVEYPSEVDAIPETIVVCALDGRYAGYLVIADKPKEDAARAVAELKSLGIEDIRILSGDREALVANLGRRLGVSEARGDLLPEGKMEILEALRGEPGKVTAFVGDGFNDAPALATSDVGVAMGALGSDAAIETADVVIQSDQPSRLPAAIRIGRLTHRIVRQNILLAIGVKVVVLTLGALGIATMWEAVFADVGVTLLAVLNAVRASNRRF